MDFEQKYKRFVGDLEILSNRYGISIQALHGVAEMNNSEQVRYFKDYPSGKLSPAVNDLKSSNAGYANVKEFLSLKVSNQMLSNVMELLTSVLDYRLEDLKLRPLLPTLIGAEDLDLRVINDKIVTRAMKDVEKLVNLGHVDQKAESTLTSIIIAFYKAMTWTDSLD